MVMRITGGDHRGRRLRAARSSGLRPTSDRVRSAVFSILRPEAIEGARVLDLYAGTGILGIEALSRGAAWADFVESDARRSQQIRDSLKELSLASQCQVYKGRVERMIDSLPGGYGLVFADPPYDMDVWSWLMERLAGGRLVRKDGYVVAEHRHTTALSDVYNKLVLWTNRRYGDTSVSIYRAGANNGQGNLSGQF